MITCIDAFKNINIVSSNNDVSVSACCLIGATKVQSLDFENNPGLMSVRASWAAGIFPSDCDPCKKEEACGNISRRQGSNWWYKDQGHDNTDVELIRLDYWTGDLCNLRCIICGPSNSSAWKEELKMPTTKVSVNKLWKDLDLSKIKFVHFNGGEPLLSKEHVEFLKELPNKPTIHINYNTNGTTLPSAELMALWEQFRLVQLDFSIDDIGERFEYQRYPAKWPMIVENLKWFVNNSPHNCMFAVNTSVGKLNQANVGNLTEWLKINFHSNRFTDPVGLRQQPVVGRFSLTAPLAPAIKFLNECDVRRGTNWQTVFPELVKQLQP